MTTYFKTLRLSVVAGLFASLLASLACGPGGVDTSSDRYREIVKAFYTGLAALEAGDDARAADQLERAAGLAPEEPATWADWGLLALRQREFDKAAERFAKARELAPQNARIASLEGLLESSRGQADAAIERYRRAVELDPGDLESAYALAAEVERRGGPEADAEVQRLYEELLAKRPDNLALLLDLARVAAKRGDAETLRRAVDRIATIAAPFPPESRAQVDQLGAAAAGDPRAAAPRVAFARNTLVREPVYQNALAEVKSPPQVVGMPIDRFLVLPVPPATPSAPDTVLAHAIEPWGEAVGHARVVWLDGDSGPVVVTVTESAVSLGGGPTLAGPNGLRSVVAADLNYDFKTDLLLAGAGGLRLYEQQTPASFADATARMALPAAVTGAPYADAWAVDLDQEGDLDLVIARVDGSTVAILNNGDGAFSVGPQFAGNQAVRDFVWADLDDDGDPDAAFLDAAGSVRFYANERGGAFRSVDVAIGTSPSAALEAADVDRDGLFELIVLGGDGTIGIWSLARGAQADLRATVSSVPGGPFAPGEASLRAAELDNNGAVDLVASGAGGTAILLGIEGGGFATPITLAGFRSYDAADLTSDGLPDLVGTTAEGRPARAVATGSKGYHWQAIRPRAKEATGDQRINSFAIGGELAVRSGLLYQKYAIDRPFIHVGLGDRPGAEIVRIVWPNGTVQAEFELAPDQAVLAEQRLKGSCPFLFAWNGERMEFVTDFIWRSPLGLKINAQETAGVVQTEDWVKIRGDQLVARDGVYDIRITADLWETHFFDHVSLLVVDHPAGTEMLVDERFAIPPPKLEARLFTPLRPLAGAWDQSGADVSDVVATRDMRHLGGFELGRYQGVASDHWVEVELPADAPAEGPLSLVATGWIYPTDSSLNVAIAQGRQDRPRSLALEVPDGLGGWRVARENLGFPEGKNKTVLVDLDGVFPPGAPRRARLRTNMEIYWDSIGWAVPLDGILPEIRRLAPDGADLGYRGFSVMEQPSRTSPDLPRYDRILTTGQRWRDLIGYYTRYGEIRELLTAVDDRYVIMNAGDEMRFRFAAPPPPREGWVRDFILVGDGWVKDGDFNTAFSATVLPLPSHGTSDYTTPPTTLEDDPVYRRHAGDWERFHTRYVTPRAFSSALVASKEARR